jgi:hypothetical protein
MRGRIFFLGCLVFAATATLAQKQLGFSMQSGRKKVVIPIEVHNNLVVVPILLNGQLPLKFILDTGVRTAILTQKAYSDILNLQYTRKYSIAGPGGEKLVDAYVTNNVTIDMPGIHGEGHALLVLEEDYLELRSYLGVDVHGILGYELFSRFVTYIDYENKELHLYVPGRFKPSRRFQVLPIQVLDTKPYLVTSIQMADSTDLTLKLLVDTGASHSLFLENWTDKRIQIPEKNVKSVIGRGIGGAITGRIARINSVALGKYAVQKPTVNFPDVETYLDTLRGGNLVFRNGTIGGEVLSRFDVVFDFPGEKIYFHRNSSYRSKFYYNLSGITVKAEGMRLRKYVISEIRSGSTGEQAGFQVGDVVLVINGVRASDLDLSSLNSILNSKPGKRVRVEIERNKEKRKIEFLLSDQI